LLDTERLRPDVITLDLEMPQLDGFAFLRLLMARRPTPVVVVSGRGDHEKAFRALELGALDFVAKPGATPEATLVDMEQRLLRCIRSVRRLTHVRVSERARTVQNPPAHVSPTKREERQRAARAVACVASSTGGPGVIEAVLTAVARGGTGAIVIAQHMPASFTKSFATRLNRRCQMPVREARDGERLVAGDVLVAPGQRNIELVRDGHEVVVRLSMAPETKGGMASLAPSGDMLLASAASAFGTAACGVVISGMGEDGREGSRAIAAAGGIVLVQDPSQAVLSSMPTSVLDGGITARVRPTSELGGEIVQFFERFA
jgi:two-component system chemotaxis response regulator CheB